MTKILRSKHEYMFVVFQPKLNQSKHGHFIEKRTDKEKRTVENYNGSNHKYSMKKRKGMWNVKRGRNIYVFVWSLVGKVVLVSLNSLSLNSELLEQKNQLKYQLVEKKRWMFRSFLCSIGIQLQSLWLLNVCYNESFLPRPINILLHLIYHVKIPFYLTRKKK